MKTMVEYAKTLLQKLSFNKELFNAGIEKIQTWLEPHEKKELEEWIKLKFKEIYTKK